MTLPPLSEVLAFLVIWLVTPLLLFGTALLWVQSKDLPNNRVARAQALGSTGVTVIVVVFALIFVNNDMEFPPLNPEQTRLVTRGMLVVVGTVYAVLMIRLFYRRRNGRPKSPEKE